MSELYFNQQKYNDSIKQMTVVRKYEHTDWEFTGKIKYTNISVDIETVVEFQVLRLPQPTGFWARFANFISVDLGDYVWVNDMYFFDETEKPTKKITSTIQDCKNEE